MQYLVLKELPQGQQPGTIVDLPEAVADVFMMPGVDAVRKVDAPEPAIKPRARSYRRTDLVAD